MFVSVSAVLCLIFCCIVFHLYLQLVFQSVLRAIVRLWVLWSIWWPTFICEWWFVAVLMLCTEKLIKHTVKVETLTRWVLLRQNLSSSQYSTTLNSFHVWISRFSLAQCLSMRSLGNVLKVQVKLQYQTSNIINSPSKGKSATVSYQCWTFCNLQPSLKKSSLSSVFPRMHVCICLQPCSRSIGQSSIRWCQMGSLHLLGFLPGE